MLLKTSRYQVPVLFTPDTRGNPVFAGIRPRVLGPATGVVEHAVQTGDRLDRLARHYYNNDRAWWRIVDANPEFVFSGLLLAPAMEGLVILIPKLKE